ncbi:MAG: ATP-dependent zinc metalloprotease FtsH [Christensenellales bacterium]
MKKFIRGPGIYVLILLVILLTYTSMATPGVGEQKKISYKPELIDLVKQNKIKAVSITENVLVGLYSDTNIKDESFPDQYDFTTNIPSIDVFTGDINKIVAEMKGKDVATISSADWPFTYDTPPKPETAWWVSLLPYIVMLLIFGGLWYMMMQQSQGGNKGVMSFGKSRARMSTGDDKRVVFDDVAGSKEEKEELQEVVEFLRNPRKFIELGARIPKGLLLVGPPGTGKTLLARAVAGEAGVPFFSISGSDFVEMFVGVGASRVRDLFETAKKSVPCIVFIDEIDAVGRHRGAGMGGGHDEREQTLNQLLVEMDGFAANEGIIIIAATNRPDILDPALLRPGRFDRQITVHYPDIKGRADILRVHSRGKPLAEEVNFETVAKMTPGFTGADLENVMNEAAILSARRGKKKIQNIEIEDAITRVIAGPEKKSRVITEKDKKITAYHESGHAIVANMLPLCDRVHEISIIPRGQAAGYTITLPDDDRAFLTREKLSQQISMMLGGRAAEVIVFDDVSTGASNDLKRVAEVARRMVVEFGMSERVGNMYLGGDSEIFIGRDFSHQRLYSEDMAGMIDHEIKKIIDDCYKRAEAILKDNLNKLHKVVDVLLEKEKIDINEFETILAQA